MAIHDMLLVFPSFSLDIPLNDKDHYNIGVRIEPLSMFHSGKMVHSDYCTILNLENCPIEIFLLPVNHFH